LFVWGLSESLRLSGLAVVETTRMSRTRLPQSGEQAGGRRPLAKVQLWRKRKRGSSGNLNRSGIWVSGTPSYDRWAGFTEVGKMEGSERTHRLYLQRKNHYGARNNRQELKHKTPSGGETAGEPRVPGGQVQGREGARVRREGSQSRGRRIRGGGDRGLQSPIGSPFQKKENATNCQRNRMIGGDPNPHPTSR